MEIILLVIVIVLLLLSRSNLSRQLIDIKLQLNDLRNEIAKLKREDPIKPPPLPTEIAVPAAPVNPPPPEEAKPLQQPVIENEATFTTPVNTVPSALVEESRSIDKEVPAPEIKVTESLVDRFLRNNPDLEKFIGENLVNKIGIAVLVLGIAFFVKYAVDKEWINETGRVAIGLVSGALLIFLAHRMINSYRSFSSVLVGGGITVFYFTFAFAFHEYHLIGQTATFIIMIAVTAFAVALALLYDRIELAIIAALGGFATPFIVSTGEGNYQILFTYLIILNTGLLVMASYKRWFALNLIAFSLTLVIYGAWMATRIQQPLFPGTGAFLLAAIFYLLFVAMNVVHHVADKARLQYYHFIMLLTINLAFYAAGIIILNHMNLEQFRGLFTAGLGMVNLILAYSFLRKEQLDPNFTYLLIGLTLTFISLAAPVQLKGNHITLFWAAEIAVLYWLYTRSQIKLLKYAAYLVTVLMLVSLAVDWVQVYMQPTAVPVMWNKAFTTAVVASIALFVTYYLSSRKSSNRIALGYLVGGIVIAFLSGFFEIGHQYSLRYPATDLHLTYLQLYIMLFAAIGITLLQRFSITYTRPYHLSVAIILYLFYLANTEATYGNELQMLKGGISQLHMIAHWASVMALIYFGVAAIKERLSNGPAITPARLVWIAGIAIVILMSIEVRNAYVWAMFSYAGVVKAEAAYYRAGLSVLWGVISFSVVWLGIRYQLKDLRVIGLALFAITLVKLFTYDLTNISPAGKILAFILLGVLLLVVSFMYQRVKKILLDDKKDTD